MKELPKGIENSFDTIGYQSENGPILEPKARVFALPNVNGYTLHAYIWTDWAVNNFLGIPNGSKEIGTARTEDEARNKLIAYLEKPREAK